MLDVSGTGKKVALPLLPKYLIQRCPLDYGASLYPDASLMYMIHFASENEMRTIHPFDCYLMYSVRTLIVIFKY